MGDEEVVDGGGLEIVFGVAFEVGGGCLLEVLCGEVGVAHHYVRVIIKLYAESVQLQALLDLVGKHQSTSC